MIDDAQVVINSYSRRTRRFPASFAGDDRVLTQLMPDSNAVSTLVLGFDRQHFLESPHKPLFVRDELGLHKRIHTLKRQRRADNPRAQHNHVHVVVLHALVRGIGIVAHAGANSGNLVAATQTPTPDPQIRIPRGASPCLMARPTFSAKSG